MQALGVARDEGHAGDGSYEGQLRIDGLGQLPRLLEPLRVDPQALGDPTASELDLVGTCRRADEGRERAGCASELRALEAHAEAAAAALFDGDGAVEHARDEAGADRLETLAGGDEATLHAADDLGRRERWARGNSGGFWRQPTAADHEQHTRSAQ